MSYFIITMVFIKIASFTVKHLDCLEGQLNWRSLKPFELYYFLTIAGMGGRSATDK